MNEHSLGDCPSPEACPQHGHQRSEPTGRLLLPVLACECCPFFLSEGPGGDAECNFDCFDPRIVDEQGYQRPGRSGSYLPIPINGTDKFGNPQHGAPPPPECPLRQVLVAVTVRT